MPINSLIIASNLFALNSDINLEDTLEIKIVNYNNSTKNSSVWININYPQILGLKNSSVQMSVNKFLEEEFKQSVDWYEEMKNDLYYMKMLHIECNILLKLIFKLDLIQKISLALF